MADIKIYGTLTNATESGKVALASQIFDAAKGKFQSQINEEGAAARKFRYAHWNVGHFTYYDGRMGSNTPDITAANSEAMALRFRKVINEVDADFFGICEDDPVFDAVGNTSVEKLYFKFPTRYQGTKYSYNCNSLYTSLPLNVSSVTEVLYPNAVQTRYYKLMVATLNGVVVRFVETHLDHNGSTEATADRYLQVQKLISDFASYPYVVIAGDFNSNPTDCYDPFISAGYELASHGYLGDLETATQISTGDKYSLDNIIAKGFRMSNVKVNETSFSLSDHAAISCDLEMIV